MPSVGMRRSTRVFGSRVLRSGRRLWTEPHEFVRGAHGENKFPGILDNSADGGGDADNCHKDTWQGDENGALMDMTVEPRTEECASDCAMEVQIADRMYGLVYRRKRKRAELTTADLTEDERYGKKFARGKWRAKCRTSESFEARGDFCIFVRRPRQLSLVLHRSSYDCGYWIACFLTSVLSYITRVGIGMRLLSAFVCSKPIFDAYSSHGMLFLQDPVTAKNPGFCVISGSRCRMPLFSVDISALPTLFAHIQTSMYLRAARFDCLLVAPYEKGEKVTDVAGDSEENLLQISSWRDHEDCDSEAPLILPARVASHGDVALSEYDTSENRQLTNPPLGLPKSSLRSLQLRNSRNIQKRRSSLRRKRGRPPSAFRGPKASGALASDFLMIRHDGAQLSAASTSRLLRSSDKRRSMSNGKELKLVKATKNKSTSSCSANLLVTETDKCYRVEGATVTLELSASKQWVLVMKGGTKHWTLTAQKAMRPPCSNRFNHAVIWVGDGGLKLEFPNKQDWLVFKELYRECSDRNMQSPAASFIPVPCVQEVLSPIDAQYIPYVRPDSYITMKDDELSRALVKKNANYDMDSDDEEWLEKMNNELSAGRELQEIITSESFELVIDALEKGFHCNPDEHLDEQAAYDYCMHLERREAIEEIHKYWIKKRKQKRSALVRVFQLYQPRRSQVIPKSVLRKKRSFKRQASQAGRGKQRPLLQAITAEQDALEQQNNVHKLQEAKSAADRYEGLAMLKRQRAQMLMENADLATYKAVMALRIAEAAQIAKAPETAASFFLEKLLE